MVAESGCRYIVVVATTDIIRLDTEQCFAMLERGYVFDEVVCSGDNRGGEDSEGLKDFCCKNNEMNYGNENLILDVILSKLSDVCANECSITEEVCNDVDSVCELATIAVILDF